MADQAPGDPPTGPQAVGLFGRLHRPLQGLDCKGHADLLSDPERPFTSTLEVLQGGWAIASGGRLFCVGYSANRLVLLACPRGLAFHGGTQAQRFLSIHDQIANVFSRHPKQDTAAKFHAARTQAFATWTEITSVAMAA